jgi:hypothetical protein
VNGGRGDLIEGKLMNLDSSGTDTDCGMLLKPVVVEEGPYRTMQANNTQANLETAISRLFPSDLGHTQVRMFPGFSPRSSSLPPTINSPNHPDRILTDRYRNTRTLFSSNCHILPALFFLLRSRPRPSILEVSQL